MSILRVLLVILVCASWATTSYSQTTPAPTITPIDFASGDGEEAIVPMLQGIYNYARAQHSDHPVYASFEAFREAFLVRYPFLVARGGEMRTTVPRRELRDRFRQPSGSLGVVLPHIALGEARVLRTTRTVETPQITLTRPPQVAVVAEWVTESARLRGRIVQLEERLTRLSGVPRVEPQAIDELRTLLRELAARVNGGATVATTNELARLVDELSVRVNAVDGRYESLEARVTVLLEDTARYVGIGFWLLLAGAGAITVLSLALLLCGLRVRTVGKRVERIEAQLPDQGSNIRALGERIEQLEVRMGREGASASSTRRGGVAA